MRVRANHLRVTAIVQMSGAVLGIVFALAFPGGHPSAAVLIGLLVIPLNLALALGQVVCRVFFFEESLPDPQGRLNPYLPHLAAGWFSTVLFFGWQWPPLFI